MGLGRKTADEAELSNDTSYRVGRAYFIRTVTHYYIGRLERITTTDLLLSSASWVPCTARFHITLSKGDLEEVEPYPDCVIVSRAAIVDGSEWLHELPRKAK